ncbi:hypothetical protein [uncultured Pontibacter sp.]|uniref:hypothetical protein n=1 Tax=uncultured Pontibacter sp. TaxID=453356 RepID=UPI0026196080|nr:hypothetical protein [uncultured Pontibacter sp.]
MSNLIKYLFLLFSLVFACAGTSEGSDAKVFAAVKEVKAKHSPESLSGDKFHTPPGLQRAEENLIVQNNSPAPPSKSQSNSLFAYLHAHELKLQSIATLYILFSKDIHRSLTSGDLIFPFHYFW